MAHPSLSPGILEGSRKSVDSLLRILGLRPPWRDYTDYTHIPAWVVEMYAYETRQRDTMLEGTLPPDVSFRIAAMPPEELRQLREIYDLGGDEAVRAVMAEGLSTRGQ